MSSTSKGADGDVVEAVAAVEVARSALTAALERLRSLRGESADEPCQDCDGTGEDQLEKLCGRKAPCERCKGTSRQPKVFPWIVTGIEWDKREALRPAVFSRGITWVSVRPCDEECKGKTYLGWLLGEIALSQSVRLRGDGTLEVSMSMHNPAIFVPDLERVVYGAGSWWAAIKTADDLRRISDADVENVWYVRALRALEASATDGKGREISDVG